jgi:hypothetical protein
MARTAYFDSNVWGHIASLSGSVTSADVQRLRSSVAVGKLRIRISVSNIEEFAGPAPRGIEVTKKLLRLCYELTDWKRPIKEVNDLLFDEIESFTQGRSSPSPLCVAPPQFEEILRGEVPEHTLSAVAESIKEHKEKMMAMSNSAREAVRAELSRVTGTRPEFDALLPLASWIAESIADGMGLGDECRAVGLEALRRRRAIRLLEGANLSLIYSQVFRGRMPVRGDFFDMQHAVLASAADFFVCHDANFRSDLSRLTIPGFAVTSLTELLDSLKT